jgi:hypothetical protein
MSDNTTDETPPISVWRKGEVLPDGCELFGKHGEEFARATSIPGLRAVFGCRDWSPEVVFRRYVTDDGAMIYYGQQYDGFAKRPYVAAMPDGEQLLSQPRRPKYGASRVQIRRFRQLRWFKRPESAMKALATHITEPSNG